MAQFKQCILNELTYYILETKNFNAFLDFKATLYGQNRQFPTFKYQKKTTKFIINKVRSTNIDTLFVTTPNIGIFFSPVKYIYITKPIYLTLLMLYEEYNSMQYYYEEHHILSNQKIVELTDIDIEKFKQKLIFINYHQLLYEPGVKILVCLTGIGLGWVNYKFEFENQTSITYITSYSIENKFYLSPDKLNSQYCLLNINDHISILDNTLSKTIKKTKYTSIDSLQLAKSILEYIDINDLNDKIVISLKQYIHNEFLHYDTIIFQYDMTMNFIDIILYTAYISRILQVNLYIIIKSYDIFNTQINSLYDWINIQHMETFSLFLYEKNVMFLENVYYNFLTGKKIIFIDKTHILPNISNNQKIVDIYTILSKIVELKTLVTIFNIKDNKLSTILNNTKIFINQKNLKFDETSKTINIMIDEHLHIYGNKLYLYGSLEITDFFSKNCVQYLINQEEHSLCQLLSVYEYYIFKNNIIIPELKKGYEIISDCEIVEYDLGLL